MDKKYNQIVSQVAGKTMVAGCILLEDSEFLNMLFNQATVEELIEYVENNF